MKDMTIAIFSAFRVLHSVFRVEGYLGGKVYVTLIVLGSLLSIILMTLSDVCTKVSVLFIAMHLAGLGTVNELPIEVLFRTTIAFYLIHLIVSITGDVFNRKVLELLNSK